MKTQAKTQHKCIAQQHWMVIGALNGSDEL